VTANIAYTIYHLDHERLLAIQRGLSKNKVSGLEAEASEQYKNLLSNLPRIDASIKREFGPRQLSEDQRIEKLNEDKEKLVLEKLNRRISAMKWLFKNRFYKEVCHSNHKHAQEAIRATTSVNSRWWLIHDNRVNPIGEPWRSSGRYDLVKRFDEYFGLFAFGFVDLQENKYAEELV